MHDHRPGSAEMFANVTYISLNMVCGQWDIFCTFLPFNSVSTKLCHVTCYNGDKKYPYIVGIGFTLNLHSVVANQSKAVKDQIKIR